MSKIRFFFFSFLKLPSTLIHETLHAIPVLIFSVTDFLFNILRSIVGVQRERISTLTSFNLIPDYRSGVLGSVAYRNVSPIQLIIINLAPLLSWILLLYFIHLLEYITIDINTFSLQINQLSLGYQHLLFLLFVPQFILAGFLSRKDMLNVFNGIVSMQFLVYLILGVSIYYLYNSSDMGKDLMGLLQSLSDEVWKNILN